MQGEGLIDEIRSRLHDYGIMLAESITFKPGESNDVIDDRLLKVSYFIIQPYKVFFGL